MDYYLASIYEGDKLLKRIYIGGGNEYGAVREISLLVLDSVYKEKEIRITSQLIKKSDKA